MLTPDADFHSRWSTLLAQDPHPPLSTAAALWKATHPRVRTLGAAAAAVAKYLIAHPQPDTETPPMPEAKPALAAEENTAGGFLDRDEKRRMLAEMARLAVPEDTKPESRIRLDTLRLRAIEMDNKMTAEESSSSAAGDAAPSPAATPEQTLVDCLKSPLFLEAFLAQEGVREAMREVMARE